MGGDWGAVAGVLGILGLVGTWAGRHLAFQHPDAAVCSAAHSGIPGASDSPESEHCQGHRPRSAIRPGVERAVLPGRPCPSVNAGCCLLAICPIHRRNHDGYGVDKNTATLCPSN